MSTKQTSHCLSIFHTPTDQTGKRERELDDLRALETVPFEIFRCLGLL